MPTTHTVGTPSAVNDKLGGIPTLHYLDFSSRGRGQVLRLFFEDAQISYEDVRYSFEEFPSAKKSLIGDLNPTGSVPVVELNGKILTQSYPILRHFARILGEYDGKTEEERYHVDVVCDIAIDWRTLFVTAFFNPNKETTYPAHQKGDRVRYLNAVERHLAESSFSKGGPFILGDRITYADLVVYQVCHDENLVQEGRKGLLDFPKLKKLVDGVEARPNVKKWLASERYFG